MLFIPVWFAPITIYSYWFVPIATLYLCCHLFSFWLNVFQWKEFTFLPPTDHWIISLFIADTVVPAGKERQIPRLWSDCSLFSFCLWSLIYLPLVFNTRMHEWTGRHLNFICYVHTPTRFWSICCPGFSIFIPQQCFLPSGNYFFSSENSFSHTRRICHRGSIQFLECRDSHTILSCSTLQWSNVN